MPYYRETFSNQKVPVTYTYKGLNGITSVQNSGSVVTESTQLTGFRSRPHREAQTVSELQDISVDPYAYFLGSISKKGYQEQLALRNLKPEGSPDRGHAFELIKHTVRKTLMDAQYQAVIPGSGVITEWYKNPFIFPGSVINGLTDIHNGNILAPVSYQGTGFENFAQMAYNRAAPTAVVFDAAQFLGSSVRGSRD